MMSPDYYEDKERDGTVLLGDHYEGFECARYLHQLLVRFETFKDLTRHVGDEIVQEVFRRKPCVRTLRYIGCGGNCQEHGCSSVSVFFVKGGLYQSIDFNGATYTISGYRDGKRRIGSAYFEWVLGYASTDNRKEEANHE